MTRRGIIGAEVPDSLPSHLLGYLTHLKAMRQSAYTVKGNQAALLRFLRWCQDRGVTQLSQVDRPLLEGYRQHLCHHRKQDGEPLTARTQHFLLAAVRLWCGWLAKEGRLSHDPAALARGGPMRGNTGRGGRKAVLSPIGGAEDPDSLYNHMLRYLTHMGVMGQSPNSVASSQGALRRFIRWCQERSVLRPSQVDRALVERFQQHLFHHRKQNGEPLSTRSQQFLLIPIRQWFSWLAKKGHLPYSPAAELELPKVVRRLPKAILSASETEAVLAVPDLKTPIGLRDRAILETFYSTGIRRTELTRLALQDVDRERGTVMIRQGKGGKDRMIPIGERALAWIAAYRDQARPELVVGPDSGTLFLNALGNPLKPFHLTILAGQYVKKSGIGKEGACHLFRHTMATLMLENGADTRYIQAMLGHASLETTQIYTKVSIRALKTIHTATHPGRMPQAGLHALAAMEDPTPEDLLEAMGMEERNDPKEGQT